MKLRKGFILCRRRSSLRKGGFTLIELLVVIAIIGVLATIVLSSLNSARSKARDAQRERDVQTIKNALEIYYLDNGRYPIANWIGSHTENWSSFKLLLGTTLPRDPLNTSNSTADDAARHSPYDNYVYSYYASLAPAFCSGQAYMLVYNKENSNGTGPNDGVQFCEPSYLYTLGNAFVTGVSPKSL